MGAARGPDRRGAPQVVGGLEQLCRLSAGMHMERWSDRLDRLVGLPPHSPGLTSDPAAVGSAPVHISRLEGKHVLEGGGGVDLRVDGRGSRKGRVY